MGDMMRFILDIEDIKGTNMERRIEQVAGEEIKTYHLKSTTKAGKFNTKLDQYTPEQQAYV